MILYLVTELIQREDEYLTILDLPQIFAFFIEYPKLCGKVLIDSLPLQRKHICTKTSLDCEVATISEAVNGFLLQ